MKMKKSLSRKVLFSLILFTVVPGILFTALAGWLAERVLINFFLQRGIEAGRLINQEFYARYFTPRYEIEKEALNSLALLKDLDGLVRRTMNHLQVERMNFFNQAGQVIYSTEKALTGTNIPVTQEPDLYRALRGEVVFKVGYGVRPDRLHGKMGTPLEHDVMEIYLPMLCLSKKLPNYGKQVGVIELYQNIDVVRQWLKKIRLYLGGALSLILGVSIIGAFSALHLAALKPIRRIVATITDPNVVLDGKLAKRIEGGSTYELQYLANSFTRMVEEVIEKSHQLNNARQMAMVDALTSLYNHRYFHCRLEEELSRADRAQFEVSLIFCDLDGFKELNDIQGHQAGDWGLKETARIIQDTKRASDIACRYGGDEFALILPGTDSEEARVLAERLRARVEEHFRDNPEEWREGLTLSVGIASYPKDAAEKEALIERADRAMYDAKHKGKNRVKVFDLAELRPSPSASLLKRPF